MKKQAWASAFLSDCAHVRLSSPAVRAVYFAPIAIAAVRVAGLVLTAVK